MRVDYSGKGRVRNQFINDRSNCNGPKASSKGICYNSSNERGEARGSTKVCQCVWCRHQWHVQLLSQVTYQVTMKTSTCKSVTHFICCTIWIKFVLKISRFGTLHNSFFLLLYLKSLLATESMIFSDSLICGYRQEVSNKSLYPKPKLICCLSDETMLFI